MKKIIGIACDHAGYELKEFILGWLSSKGFDVIDYGCASPERVDYPDYGHALARGIESGEIERGVGICGSGVGISIALNRHNGVRAGLCWSEEIAALIKEHNNANVVVLPARFVDNDEAISIVNRWLESEFEGSRHQMRIDKLDI